MALAEAIDELNGQCLNDLDDAALHEHVVELEQLGQRLESLKATALGVWDARQVWASDGSKAPGARLARDAHRSPVATRAEVRRARRLCTMPLTADAFDAGRIAIEHVDRLVVCNQPRFRALFVRDEHLLVGFALDLAFDDFARAVTYWLQLADDDLAEDRATRDRERRSASCAPTIGGVRDVQARLDPVGGAIFEQELFRLERLLFETDWAEARAIHGEATQLDHLARTTAQRRADALVLIAERSAAMPPDAKQARVLVSVLIDSETLLGRLCELMDGTVITPGQLVPYLDRADLERLLYAGKSRVIEVGPHTPFYKGALRRILDIRDRHCQFPGCREPAERCDADHIDERCNGGPTTQDNGRLLCPTHNRQRPGRRQPASDPGQTDTDGDGDEPP